MNIITGLIVILSVLMLGLLGSIFFLSYKIKKTEEKNSSTLPKNLLEKSEKIDNSEISSKLTNIGFNGTTYQFTYFKVEDNQRLKLYANFDYKLSTKDILPTKNCQYLVNGGFYSQDYQPLGWFYADGKTLSEPIKSNLLDGFLYLDNEGFFIDKVFPKLPVRFGLQSGPLLFMDSSKLDLKIINDQQRRRVLAALNKNNELFFAIVVGKESFLSGPYLQDLPEIVSLIAKSIDQNFVDAINLDGGSASAFLSPELIIEETSSIGSFFCLTN